MHSLKRAFFWLSGAGTETLEQCPPWEQRKYVAFGATVLVPCAFAFIACAYALSTLTDNARVIYPVAAVWAFIILTIDRALLASYRPYMSLVRKLSQFSLRLVVAVLMGITIAHPLVLLLFRDTVSSVIEKDRAAEIEVVRGGFEKQKEKIRGQVTTLETALAEQRAKWNESFQAKFIIQETEEAKSAIPGLTSEQQTELKAAIDEGTAPFRERLTAIEKQSDELTPQYAKLQSELGFWQAEFERELNGQRSGMKGEGPRARSVRSDQLEPRREESKRLGGLLEHLTAEKSTLQTQSRQAEAAAIKQFETKLAEIAAANRVEAERVAGLKQKVENDQAGQFVTQQNSLRETIKQQIDTRLAELNRTQGELAAVATEEANRLAAMRAEPRRDILTQTLALHALFKAGNEGGQFAFYTYIVLTLLFMLVDTIPLIVKFFTKPGPYDTLVDRDEITFDSEHRAFRQSRVRYMEQLSTGNLIAVTRNQRLEHALVDGVEHTRAAREFLDSLIEMEKAFAEKMKLEEQTIGVAESDKRAALEAIKKRFYDDLNHRMEIFFSSRHVPEGV
ncbi:DUF4407 domain-containing protein [Luteolibacter yonseiensis]|uniref:DUF4407 domain-containing protein n=1 Tax=Luteolibacter yonseiensis TaxID=1144680 RepID=A0A934VAC6_9BACT|nr:DUF4407 domain-containing protein [Luteolibacter yonseiensis]MBK1814224.1 DUF4407 domain-containing protein [Luteolibacter yonseiensis]